MVLLAATSVAAKDWRGILPMHSTREDVEAILGPPPPPPEGRSYTLHKGRSIYFLEEGEVYITFEEDEPDKRACPSNVPAGTVLMIEITPKDDLLFASLNIDVKRFKSFDASEPSGQGYDGFVSEEEGFAIRVFEKKVQAMVYVASASDRGRCPSFYQNIEGLVQTSAGLGCGLLAKFDEYGDLPFSDEKARLDNFAIQLVNDEDMRGYIIVYAGRKATVAEAQVRGMRARDYLISARKINPERLKAIDGGHREELTIELYVLPKDVDVKPPGRPTVDRSEVEIIYQKKRRSKKRN